MKHTVNLERVALRRSHISITRRQVEEIVERGLGGDRGRQFKLAKPIPLSIDPTADAQLGWVYKLELEFEHTGKGDPEKQFNVVKDMMSKAAPSKGNWCVIGHTPTAGPAIITLNGVDAIADVNVEREHHFDHLYGLDAQIEILLAALKTAKDTNYAKRFHCVLYGKPGCGKSEILRGVKHMVGQEGVIELDGTQTTAAGAINILMEAAVLPPLLIIEEIEKVPDAAFMWLLGALDGRAEIRKVNNNGVRQRKMPFVCAATVNDLSLFKSRHEGAMASRFAHSIYCPRPSEEILRRILRREADSIQGNPAWIEPAIRYCIDKENTTDPRRVIAVCLTGRDKLLSGEFQKNLIACSHKDE